MDSDTESDRAPAKVKSKRPPNNAFRQQRLKAWQPVLTPRTVLPLFFGVTCLFALFGGLLLKASSDVQEILLDYTTCSNQGSEFTDMSEDLVTYSFDGGKKPDSTPQWRNQDGDCTLRFNIPTDMGSPVYMFYRLTNFYQNHRRYVLSYNQDQLLGNAKTAKELEDADDCKPLITDPETGKPYYPCGLIANSLFNDTFSSLQGQDGADNYDMTRQGIAWSNDKNWFQKTDYNASDVVPPPNWVNMFPDGYTDETLPDISQWEELQNWMRTAGLPTFSKLALRNDDQTLRAGTYEVNIGLNFDTTLYEGKKMLLLSTRTAIGGKNNFLGIAYCVVAGLSCALGLAFLIHHVIRPRRIGDHTYLSWNQ